ncbi:hypothetical protein [Aureibacter tunicatorum]|uniref:GDSL-like lipase/acylhydrolase family protein n=1 Tax=Aureibacter tunicatorum TaxID=866807 RepID=A0AAE3XLE7_9BACT|nr:hypothetical protein [Aureibacter tunicatorum]MDR6238163.1 hypothetical protein [Aureibacter tunicatorum]
MRNNNILYIVALLFSFAACKDLEPDVDYANGSGSLDVSKYVAIGNSLTAGFANNGLYEAAQVQSFPAIFSKQLTPFGINEISQPIAVRTGTGYQVLTGFDPQTGSPIIDMISNEADQMAFMQKVDYSINNYGVPGIKVMQLNTPLLSANPFFARISNDGDTYLDLIKRSEMTFFTMWLGSNDVLDYAIVGGSSGEEALTPQAVFEGNYSLMLDVLKEKQAKGVIGTIPDIGLIPFFTTVGPTLVSGLKAQGFQPGTVPVAQAAGLEFAFKAMGYTFQNEKGEASDVLFQRGNVEGAEIAYITPYFESGKTGSKVLGALRWDESNQELELTSTFIPLTAQNGVLAKLAFIEANIAKALEEAAKGNFELLIEFIFASELILDPREYGLAVDRTGVFNNFIEGQESSDFAIYHSNDALMPLANPSYLLENGTSFTSQYILGGAFSLDGIHMTPRGYAYVANGFIDAANKKFGSKFPRAFAWDYPAVDLP